jgi:hypothetical protein
MMYGQALVIWRHNHTPTYTSYNTAARATIWRRSDEVLPLNFGENDPRLSIVGETEDEIARTAAYLIIEEREQKGTILVTNYTDFSDFRAARSHCF